jgi:hypothetical protein
VVVEVQLTVPAQVVQAVAQVQVQVETMGHQQEAMPLLPIVVLAVAVADNLAQRVVQEPAVLSS